MRVLIVHTFYKLPGGEDAVVQHEMELLLASGHTVELLPFHNASKTLLNVLFMPFNPLAYQKALKKIKSFLPDIIHIHNFHFAASPAILYAAKKMNVPVVMTMHNFRLICPSGSLFLNHHIFTASLHESFPWSAVKKGAYQHSKAITFWLALSNYIHRKIGTWNIINTMIFLGEHSKSLYKQAGIITPKIATAIKPNFTTPKTPGEAITKCSYFLYVGRLTEEKGISTLLNAFIGQQALLKIAGIGPLENLVIQTASANSNIDYLGQCAPEEIETLMRGAKALIFPSEWFETFGMVIIEAFSLGRPVIASRLGNIPSIVKENVNGLLFEAANADSLKKVITAFDEMEAEKKLALSNQALESFKNSYVPKVNLQKLINIYKQCGL